MFRNKPEWILKRELRIECEETQMIADISQEQKTRNTISYHCAHREKLHELRFQKIHSRHDGDDDDDGHGQLHLQLVVSQKLVVVTKLFAAICVQTQNTSQPVLLHIKEGI